MLTVKDGAFDGDVNAFAVFAVILFQFIRRKWRILGWIKFDCFSLHGRHGLGNVGRGLELGSGAGVGRRRWGRETILKEQEEQASSY